MTMEATYARSVRAAVERRRDELVGPFVEFCSIAAENPPGARLAESQAWMPAAHRLRCRGTGGPRVRGAAGRAAGHPPVPSRIRGVSSAVTPDELLRRQARLQAEADDVYRDLGLHAALGAVGRPVRVGSGALGLMVRRDLDITTVCPALDALTTRAVAELGARLAQHPRVRSVRIRDDTGHWNTDPNYPDGLYLGIDYRTAANQDWTLDLWFVDEPDRQPDLAHARDLPPRLDNTSRAAILAIKQARPDVPGVEVYRAVLDGGVRSTADFDQWQAGGGPTQPT